MANQEQVEQGARSLAEQAEGLAATARSLAESASQLTAEAATAAASGPSEFYWLLTVFVLAVFVGYYVVWRVTPALHSPLMAVTNAVSSVIIVGAMLAAGPDAFSGSKVLGFIAVVLASVNIFGGFVVTQRMLSMFKKKQK
jgi:NAD(P) transhydrogenase subunit alpha